MIAYCPLCGSPNNYSLEKPKTCIKCGKAFASAFKIILPKSEPIYQDDEEEEVKPRVVARRRPSRVIDSDVYPEEDDPREKEAIKQDLIAKLQASGGVRVNKPVRNSVKWDELVKNPDILDQFENPASKPAPLAPPDAE